MSVRKTVSMILPAPYVVPDELLVKLRYNISGDHIGTGLRITEFNGNNANAVFVGGPGENAAMGMNQWAQFYNNYQVVGSKCSLQWLVDVDPALKRSVKVAMVPYTSPASPPTTIDQASEMTYGKTLILAENQNKQEMLSNYMSTKKILGYHNNIDDVEFTHANTASKISPTKEWRWGIFTQSLAAQAYQVQFDGYIDYYVRLFARRTLARSLTPAS